MTGRAYAKLLAIVGGLAYAVLSVDYYTRLHGFDPFTQMPLVRVEDPIPPKGAGEVRVLALGGSTTEDADLPPPDRYPTVVRQRLAAAYPGRTINVLNAGRDWHTSRHHLIEYVTYYQDWHPDIVIVLAGVNDLYRSFSPEFYAIGPYDPLYSHFYGAASDAARPLSFEQHLFRRWAGPIVTTYWYEAPFVRKTSVDYPLDAYPSLSAFESNLRKLVAVVRSSGAELVLVTQPTLYKPQMTTAEQKVLWFGEVFCATRKGFAHYEYPSTSSLDRAMRAFNERTRTVARSEHILFVDAAESIPKTLSMFEDDCHHTVDGAKRLGELVANGIIQAGSFTGVLEGVR